MDFLGNFLREVMSEQTYNNVVLSPVVLLKGKESVFYNRAFRRLKDQALEQDPNVEITIINSASYEKSQLYMYTSPSLFGEAKLIKVENLQNGSDDFFADLIEYIKNPEPDIWLVLQHNGVVRGKKVLDVLKKEKVPVVKCDEVKNSRDKLLLVQSDVKQANRKITSQAAKALVDALGDDLEGLLSATAQLLFDIDGEKYVFANKNVIAKADGQNTSSGKQPSNKISLSNASKEDLKSLNGIGDKIAERIIKYRSKNGSFQNIEQLRQVKGIGRSLFDKIKDEIVP